jgi:hypothetical protein
MNKPSPPNDDWKNIAKRMTDARLSLDLHRLADNIRFYGAEQREAILREAAMRLGPGDSRD